jgi:hypothetical protein
VSEDIQQLDGTQEVGADECKKNCAIKSVLRTINTAETRRHEVTKVHEEPTSR